jgi:sporulation protein YlmC with PRC-barrel domain
MTATEPVEPAEDMAADAGAEAPAEDMAADDTAAEEPDATADATAPAPSGDMAADATAEQDLAAADAGTDSTTEPEAAVDATADATTEPDAATSDAADATAGEDLAADADADTGADATAEQDVAAAGTDAAPMDGDAGFMSFDASQIRASTMLGKEVLGPDDESIGEISDLVLQEDGDTRAAIIDVGGFLGAGEKPVAIPFDQIEVQPQEGGEPRLSIAMTREELEQAPAFEDATMGSEEDMAATDQTGAEAPADVTADTATEPAPADDIAADATAPAEGQDVIAGSQEGTGAYELATQDLSAEELIGSAVYGSNDENLGEVGDVVFADSGDIEAVVVDVGGFLGVGEKPVAVQFDALNVQKDTAGDVQLMINASQEQLEGAPTYQEEQAAVQ